MCGGYYEQWETPKQLQVINGKKLVERTIRLLKENGCKDIVITSNDKRFDKYAERLEHENSYRYENGKLNGYWLDAFYPKFRKNTKVTFLFGDVYFTEDAIKQIVNCNASGNVLFGSIGATVVGKVWGEPFAYVVNDLATFYDGISAVKKMQDEGLTNRVPIVWELYRYLNGIDVNTHLVKDDTYKVIDDGTNDVDNAEKLEKLRDRFEVKTNVFTVISLNSIGGGESFLYYLAKKYKDKDITIYYQRGDIEQVYRLRKYARCVKYNGEKIKCKRVFFNYNQAFKENIEAEEYYQIIHADYYKRKLIPKEDDRVKYIAVSEAAAESFTKQTGLECKVCYNPIIIEKKKPLILMSATRLTKGKGKERTEKLANILEAKGVEFLWFIFTNDKDEIRNDKVVYLKPNLKATDYFMLADWFVQLSDDEAYCYSVVEALTRGVPCIVTDIPVFKEIGLNETNSITLDFELSDVPVELIEKGLTKVKYKALQDAWGEILGNEKSNYIAPEVNTAIVTARSRYYDVDLQKNVNLGEMLKISMERAKYLKSKGLVDIVGA